MLEEDSPLDDVFAGNSKEYQEELRKVLFNTGQGWMTETLKVMYSVFIHTHQGHLDMLDCLIHKPTGSRNYWGTEFNNNDGFQNGKEHSKFNVETYGEGGDWHHPPALLSKGEGGEYCYYLWPEQ